MRPVSVNQIYMAIPTQAVDQNVSQTQTALQIMPVCDHIVETHVKELVELGQNAKP